MFFLLCLLPLGSLAFLGNGPPLKVSPSFPSPLSAHNSQKKKKTTSTLTPFPQKKKSESASSLLRTAEKLRAEAKELELQLHHSDLDSLFQVADVYRDGRVTPTSLKSFLKKEMVDKASPPERAHNEELVDDEACVQLVFDDLDANRDGALQRDEWVSLREFKARLEDHWTSAHWEEVVNSSEALSSSSSAAAALSTTPRKEHPTVTAYKRIEERLEIFEARANQTGPLINGLSALAYLLPALEAAHYSPNVLASLSDLYMHTPFLGIVCLLALFNVAIDYRVPRLLRFSARHAVILDLLAAFVIAPTLHVLETGVAPEVADFAAVVLPAAFQLLVFACAANALTGKAAAFMPFTGQVANTLTEDCDNDIISVIKTVTEDDLNQNNDNNQNDKNHKDKDDKDDDDYTPPKIKV